jgi:O-antigen/teichoic acid export membrane protein
MILLGGSEFADGAVFLQMIIFAVIGVYVGATFTHAILAVNRQQKIMWVFAVNAFIAAAGYLLFIPAWGGYAGAVITLINEFFVPLLVAVVLYRLIRFKLSLKVAAKLLVCAGVAAACVWPLREMSLVVSLGVGALVYLGLVFAVKAVSLSTIKELLHRPA